LATSPEKVLQVERTIQKSSAQYLLINLDKEKHIKVKKGSPRIQNASPKDISEDRKMAALNPQ